MFLYLSTTLQLKYSTSQAPQSSRKRSLLHDAMSPPSKKHKFAPKSTFSSFKRNEIPCDSSDLIDSSSDTALSSASSSKRSIQGDRRRHREPAGKCITKCQEAGPSQHELAQPPEFLAQNEADSEQDAQLLKHKMALVESERQAYRRAKEDMLAKQRTSASVSQGLLEELREVCESQRKAIDEMSRRQQMEEDRHKQLKQDMLLDMCNLRKETAAKTERNLKRLAVLKQVSSAAEAKTRDAEERLTNLKHEHETLSKAKESQKRIYDNCIASLTKKMDDDRAALEKEIDSLHDQDLLMQNDLVQLRDIELEDVARRKRAAQGLPPAYGSLDEEDNQPPWGQHEDQGAFALSTLKKLVNKRFTEALHNIFAQCDTIRAEDPSGVESSNNHLFRTGLLELADISRLLRGALNNPENVLQYKGSNYFRKFKADPEAPLEQALTVSHEPARRDYTGSRVAKLLLDLHWRLASALELRPSDIDLRGAHKAQADLAFTEIDATMLQALQMAFNIPSDSRERVVYEMQYWETLLRRLRGAFKHSSKPDFFEDTFGWLDDQIAAERQRAAVEEGATEQAHRHAEVFVAGGSAATAIDIEGMDMSLVMDVSVVVEPQPLWTTD